jgi:lipoyl(octanoyl) transferase
MADFNFVDKQLLDYKECWDLQESLLAQIVEEKRLSGGPSATHFFLLVEHPHVYTLGKSGNEHNLLIREDFLKKIDATYYRINRGGDITYHGPGQLVGYPIIDLEYFRLGIREFIARMEESIIGTLGVYGLRGQRKEGATGVWLDAEDAGKARKICAIGVRVSRFVTMHGFALNVNTDLRYFSYINPCGFSSFAVTSLAQELGSPVEMEEIKEVLKAQFCREY